MKKIPGSLLFLFLPLFANIKYSLLVSKNELFVKEPLLITLHIEKEDKKIYNFEFSIIKNRDFDIRFLNKLSKGKMVDISYVLFPLKEGQKEIKFHFVSKEVTDEQLSDTFIGSADEQIKYIDWEKRGIKLKPLDIFVKKTPKAMFYGRYTIKREVDKTKASAFSPVYLVYTIKGTGYLPKDINFTPKTEGVKILKDKPQISQKLTPEGFRYKATFQYAIIAEKSFRIKKRKITVFNYQKTRETELEPIEISIKESVKSTLADKENSPKKIKPFFENIKIFFGYLIIFLSGFITAKLLKFPKRDNTLSQKISKAKDEKELLKILILQKNRRFEKYILLLDNSVYQKKRVNLKKIKREILKDLR